MEKILQLDTRYKKLLGRWGENQIDAWMQSNGWLVHKKNHKIRKGEIDRVYKYLDLKQKNNNFCVAEIKTLCCRNKKQFSTLFTEVGLSSLVKYNQIINLYKYSENLMARNLISKQINNIYIRFFIVLKIYEGYENECFFHSQKIYKVCVRSKNNLILSMTPEYK